MLLKDLKKNMILPRKEILINKIVKIREIDVHLISITSEEDRNVLWAIYQSPCHMDEEIDPEERTEYTSNRDKMINNITKERSSCDISIYEMIIQNKKMTFSSSSGSRVLHSNYEEYMKLQHFIEGGMSTTNWDEVDVSNIFIVAYKQSEDEEFPEIDLSRELDITIKISNNSKQILVDPPMPIRLKFGEMEKGNKFYFYDPIEKKERIFYINKMEHYDIWEDINQKFESEEMQAFPKEQLEEMKEQYLDGLGEICPKGMNLAMLEYEAEGDIQLDFYTKEYLEKKPVYRSSSTGILFRSDKEFGINGLKSRLCMIKPVEKDFNGSIDIELFSWYMKIPEEIIRI